MISKLLFILIALITCFLISCSDNSNVVNNNEHLYDTLYLPDSCVHPVNPGNQWIYLVKYFDESGNIFKEFYDTARIVSKSFLPIYIEDEKYYLPRFLEYHSSCPDDTVIISYVTNIGRDWYHTECIRTNLLDEYQPYPKFFNNYTLGKGCGVGWGYHHFSKYNGDTGLVYIEYDPVWMKEIKIVPAGTFECYIVNQRIRVLDSNIQYFSRNENYTCPENNYIRNLWYALGTGLIKYEYYKIDSLGNNILLVEAVLKEYFINEK